MDFFYLLKNRVFCTSCIFRKKVYSEIVVLQGGVRFPTGGKVRDLHLQPSRCDSDTNSIVWMKEERVWRFSGPVQMYRAFLFMICMCLYSFLMKSVGAAHRFIDVNRFSYWRKNQTMRRSVNSFLRERREKWKTKTLQQTPSKKILAIQQCGTIVSEILPLSVFSPLSVMSWCG